jgi:hypothetical protein
MIPFFKVVHYNPDGIEYNLSPYVLNIQVSLGKEATKNTVTIELQNHNGELNNQEFTIADSSVVVYLDWQPIVIGTTLPLISASLSSLAFPTDNNGKYKLKIKATDKTAMLLSKMWAQAYTEVENLNASEIIINLVGHLNDLDGDSGNGTQLGKTPLTTTHVSTTKQNGSALPKPISMSKIWKPGYEWLNDLSQPENTGEDRPYIYYVDESNDLHWHYPFQKPITTLTSNIDAVVTTIPVTNTTGYPSVGTFVIEDEAITYTGLTSTSFTGCTRGAKFTNAAIHTSGTEVSGLFLWIGKQDIYSLSVDTTEDATYNFIIYNGGPTPEGYELLDYSLDLAQVGKKFRMKFFDWKSVGKDIMNAEKNRSDWPDVDDNFPTGAYPWTPWWLSTTVANDEAYQAAFEQKIREMCETKCKAYYITGKQKYKASCQIRGTTAYQVGDLVNVVSPKFGFTPTGSHLILRIEEVKHQLNKSGWETAIELSEDSSAIATST